MKPKDKELIDTCAYILSMEDITDLKSVMELASARIDYLRKRNDFNEGLKRFIADAKKIGLNIIDDRTGEVMDENLIFS